MVEPSVLVDNLSFRYQGRKRPAFQNVSLTVWPGETLLVLGPSGCGKSTLTMCFSGVIPHSIAGDLSGRVEVNGRDVISASVAESARLVGTVFQDPDTQFCTLRVDDEIAFGLENLRIPPAEIAKRITWALDLVGLSGRERLRIDRLSGGGRQRLALACVLAMDPPVLVFDEPTSNLDPTGAEDVFNDIARLRQQGTRSIIVVEHRLDHVMGLVDRVLVLGPGGTVIATGSPNDVLEKHASDLDEYGIWVPQVSDVARRLRARGITVSPYPITVDQAASTIGELLRSTERVDDLASPTSIESSVGSVETFKRSPGSSEVFDERELAIRISHLTYAYPSGQHALDDINLEIPRGSFVAIVGPNGAGKSTLARHLIGTIRPEPGCVRLFGRDVRTTPPKDLTHLVGYVFQNPEHQFVARTVYEELAFGLRIRGIAESEIHERVTRTLQDFGLAALGQANPFTLSHGEKRRLSVATMLILGQEILVLDEPTFGQDRRNTDALMQELMTLNAAGRTIIMITHDVRLVAEYARRVVVLVGGRIAFDGQPRHLLLDPAQLELAHLTPPPILELSRRLADVSGSFPLSFTNDEVVDTLTKRLDWVRELASVAGKAPTETNGRSTPRIVSPRGDSRGRERGESRRLE